MESKPLSPIIFIPFLVLIFIRPFFAGMAYPVFEFYYEISLILTAIIALSHKNLHKSPLAAYEVNYTYPILLLLSAYIISTAISINIPQITGEKFIKRTAIINMGNAFCALNLSMPKTVASPITTKIKTKNIFIRSLESSHPVTTTGS